MLPFGPVKALGIDLDGNAALAAAKHAVKGILTGNLADAAAVRVYVGRAMATATPPPVRVLIPAVEIADTSVTADNADIGTSATVRKRTRSAASKFSVAADIFAKNPLATRSVLTKLLADANIPKQSANVYMWRYFTKGERP